MEVIDLSFNLIAVLFLVAIIAGFVDTLVGGGGLISIPALILSGVPPLAALGTNKLQGSIGTVTATYLMIRRKVIRLSEIKGLMLIAFISAALGTVIVQFINTELLSFMIPVVLTFIGIYFLVSPTPEKKKSVSESSKRLYRRLVIPLIGSYDGLFGPGTGAFFTLSGVACKGHDLITATATAKALNFSTNIASLIIFIIAGQVVWLIGLVMLLGQIVGAWLGSHCLFKMPALYLRALVVLSCLVMLINYFVSKG